MRTVPFDGSLPTIERSSTNVTQVVYTRALGAPGGIGGLISQARAGVTNWYHYVHTGPTNVSHLTNSTGAVIQRYEFDAFGNVTYTSGIIANDYRFQTKQLHPKSNLVYFGARWYNSAIGRWTTPDPAGMIDGPNLYVYLNNNPINLIDSWGRCGGTFSDFEKWIFNKLLKKYIGKTGTVSIPVPEGKYKLFGFNIKVNKPGTTIDVNFRVETNRIVFTSVTSSNFTIKDYFGPLDVNIDFFYYNFETKNWVAEGDIMGVLPIEQIGKL